MNKNKTGPSCPCGSGNALENCCQPYLNAGKVAPTAEALMRSRFTAYALRDARYLLDSWHGSTRPATLELEPDVQWIRLKILGSSRDCVEFIATYRVQGKAHKLHEDSRFLLEGDRWYYLDGEQE